MSIGILFTVGVLLKLFLLFRSQGAVDGDESVVGLMALRILEQGDHPLYMDGQGYDAGAGILAHLAAAFFAVLGPSGISLKLAALCIWLAVCGAATWWAWRHLGPRGGLVAGALLLFSPGSIEWSMKARGGHMLASLGVVILLAIVTALMGRSPTASASTDSTERKPLLCEKTKELLLAASAGFVGAAAVWMHPSALTGAAMLLLIAGGALLVRRRLKSLAALVGGWLLPVVVVLWTRPTGGNWDWKLFAGLGLTRDTEKLFFKVLPGAFTPDLDWAIPPAPDWIQYAKWWWLGIWMASMVMIATVALSHGQKLKISPFTALALIALSLSTCGTMFILDSKYVGPYSLLPLLPTVCLTIAAATELTGSLLSTSGRRAGLALLPAVILVAWGAVSHVIYFGSPTIHGAGEQQQRTDARLITDIVRDLEAKDIHCVFSYSQMYKWNLMFESKGKIVARGQGPDDRYPPYVERVNEAYLKGARCAVLYKLRSLQFLDTVKYAQKITPERFQMYRDLLAVDYSPSAIRIEQEFYREGGWRSWP